MNICENDFRFPIVNFPWLHGDVHRLPSFGVNISQLVRFARCCTSVLYFNSKHFHITSKLLTQGYDGDYMTGHVQNSTEKARS